VKWTEQFVLGEQVILRGSNHLWIVRSSCLISLRGTTGGVATVVGKFFARAQSFARYSGTKLSPRRRQTGSANTSCILRLARVALPDIIRLNNGSQNAVNLCNAALSFDRHSCGGADRDVPWSPRSESS
jgi:hypothetical protein